MSLQFELVLPCYNEAQSLEKIVDRAVGAAQDFGFNANSFNLVLIENGSKDNSLEIMNQLKQGPKGPWIRVVPVAVNRGYGFGLWSGLQVTRAPFVAWSHADQQCDPKDAFLGLQLIKHKNQRALVKGVRRGRDWKDQFVSRFFELLATLLLKRRFYEINAQPKVFTRDLLSTIDNPPTDFAFDLYFLYRALNHGAEIQTIPVDFPPRVHGFSNWSSNFLSRWKHIRNMIKYIWDLSRNAGKA